MGSNTFDKYGEAQKNRRSSLAEATFSSKKIKTVALAINSLNQAIEKNK